MDYFLQSLWRIGDVNFNYVGLFALRLDQEGLTISG